MLENVDVSFVTDRILVALAVSLLTSILGALGAFSACVWRRARVAYRDVNAAHVKIRKIEARLDRLEHKPRLCDF
jgi:hypothetical protein